MPFVADVDPLDMTQAAAPPPLSEKASKRRQQLQWSQAWHDARRAARRPEPRDIDRALAEALAFSAYDISETLVRYVDLRSIVDAAKLLLRERGYAEQGLRVAVLKRLKPRADHNVRTRMVSRHWKSDPMLVTPPRRGGDAWTDQDIHLINRVVDELSPKA